MVSHKAYQTYAYVTEEDLRTAFAQESLGKGSSQNSGVNFQPNRLVSILGEQLKEQDLLQQTKNTKSLKGSS